MRKQIGFLKTTAIGGLLFLLPLMVIGYFVAQLVYLIQTLVFALQGYVTLVTPAGIALLTGVAIAMIVLACFGAGIIARRTIGKRFSGYVERYLTMFFPRYTIIKTQMSRSIDDKTAKQQLKPVLVQLDDCSRVAFEIERGPDRVTIYLPGAPDPWNGSVIFLNHDQVESLNVDVSAALSIFENLGRDPEKVFARASGDE